MQVIIKKMIFFICIIYYCSIMPVIPFTLSVLLT